MKRKHDLLVAIALAVELLPLSVRAEVQPRVVLNNGEFGAARLANGNAKAMPILRSALPDTSRARAETAGSIAPAAAGVNRGAGAASAAPAASPRAFGSFGIPYTETRVEGGASSYGSRVAGGAYLSTTIPYARIGRLTFDMGGGTGYCTASLIRRNVIVTAAHCIQRIGSGNNFFQDWVFTPAYYRGVAPYGSFGWRAFAVSPTWSNGSDTGLGDARNNDMAVIILSKNANNQFIGDMVGWFNYAWNNYSYVSSPKTGNMLVAEMTTFSYSSVLDGGEVMQRTDGPSYLTTIGGALQQWQGSNFSAGSSGGPWLVNFRSGQPALSGGAVVGTSPHMAVVGVTSWGSPDPNPDKDNYASRFGQTPEFPNAAYGPYGAGNIGALLQAACTQQISPGVTFAAAGYC